MYPNFEIERLPDEKFKTYLDTFGRSVLTFKAKNLDENHIKNIEVRLKNALTLTIFNHKELFYLKLYIQYVLAICSLVSLHHE